MNAIKYSVIVPVTERCDDLIKLYKEYSEALGRITDSWEFIFVFDFSFSKQFNQLKDFKKDEERLKLVRFGRDFGESVALTAGFSIAQGEYIFTLASYFQVHTSCFEQAIQKLHAGVDMVITQRFPRKDPFLNRLQSRFFHALVGNMVNFKLHDMSCGFRGMKADIAKKLNLTGDFHRFLPILAHKSGHTVGEIQISQREEDTKLRLRGIGTYVSRLIDIVSLFFLVRFTRKPLRFFGMVGASMSGVGFLVCVVLAFLRLFTGYSLSDKPSLLLGVVLLVVGVQIISIGLIGELIIFVHAREIQEYTIEEIV
ncbi:glycosyltransferase [Candidatus Omnitrophota bacterium]